MGNEDDSKGEQVKAMVDPCRGRPELELSVVSKGLQTEMAFINEPGTGMCANCLPTSHINEAERDPENRYALWIVTGLPVLPIGELFMDYGPAYERDYERGHPCPTVFTGVDLLGASS